MKKKNSKREICQCCFYEKNASSMCQCTKGHNLCKKCIQKYVHSQMSEGRPSSKCFACVGENLCNAEFPYEQLLKVIGKETMSEMIKQETINAIHHSNIPDIFICAHCGYQFSLVNKKSYRVKYCPSCNKGTCVRCGGKEHIGKTCKEAQLREKFAQQGITLCPKCKLEFIKDRGCNMLKCSRCGIRFCFNCGKVIPDYIGYKHFSDAKKPPKGKCPLRSNNRAKRNLILAALEEASKPDNEAIVQNSA